MFNIGWPELMLIGVVLILAIGPKEFPRALRTISQFTRQARGLAAEFRGGLNQMMREAELEDMKREVKQTLQTDIAGDLRKDIENSIDPHGELAAAEKDIRALTDPAMLPAPPTSGANPSAVNSASAETAPSEAEPPANSSLSEPVETVAATSKKAAG